MSHFESHLRAGVVAHVCAVFPVVVAAGALLESLPSAAGVALGVSWVTLVGSVTPDLDQHSSKPYRYAATWVPVVGATSVFLVLTGYRSGLARLVGMFGDSQDGAFLSGAVAVAIAAGSWHLIRVGIPLLRPPHRGILHTLRVGALLALAAMSVVSGFVGLAGYDPVAPGIAAAWAFFVGFVSHLYLDGLLLSAVTRE